MDYCAYKNVKITGGLLQKKQELNRKITIHAVWKQFENTGRIGAFTTPGHEEIHKIWQEMWLKTYKPFGLEAISGRIAHIIIRLEYLKDRIEKYLDGTLDTIEELGTEILENKKLALKGGYSKNVMFTGTLS